MNRPCAESDCAWNGALIPGTGHSQVAVNHHADDQS